VSTVYISIGNSDDKLTQQRWADFVTRTHLVLDRYASTMHGSWFSGPAAPWQNACWCVELVDAIVPGAKDELRLLAREFGQDSIAWAVAPETEFLCAG
jgi:hypothetical protein